MKNAIIGKPVIVRASIAGVHAGVVESINTKTQTVTLTNARRLWRVYTRDKSGSISDVAANGLVAGKEHQIGAKLAKVVIINPAGLEIAEMTSDAYKSVLAWE
jgi:hypothetical protein